MAAFPKAALLVTWNALVADSAEQSKAGRNVPLEFLGSHSTEHHLGNTECVKASSLAASHGRF